VYPLRSVIGRQAILFFSAQKEEPASVWKEGKEGKNA
jgi:hypothetical protein